MGGLLRVVLAIGLGVVIWRVSMYMIRMLATPPPEVDPGDVVPADQDYRCSVCGTELTVRIANNTQPAPPKHCREEMVAVWRPY
ncbi:MAG: hypothetical protein LC739_14170 [Actinobacteria bacterium]|nr:hypothetical protein [Acidimicrobiia bacterium]MCA1737193.1 hypothetical protein [Actinomycetota bacterium]MDQ3500512.1 hypothetical protein [Actinomycetota bacterium]